MLRRKLKGKPEDIAWCCGLFFRFLSFLQSTQQWETKKSQERLLMLPKYKRREAAPNNQAELTVPQHFRSIRFEKQFPRLSMAQNEYFPIMTPASAIRQTGWDRGCALNDTKKQFRRLLLANHRSQARERTPSGNSATRHVAGVSGFVPNALLFDFFFLLPTLVQ